MDFPGSCSVEIAGGRCSSLPNWTNMVLAGAGGISVGPYTSGTSVVAPPDDTVRTPVVESKLADT